MLDIIGAIALAYVGYLFYVRLGEIRDAVSRAADAAEAEMEDEDDEGDDDDPDDGERVPQLRAVNG
jgi:hypothetical protein